MLNSYTPVLQIKTSGYQLNQVREMEIVVRTSSHTIKKRSEDVEVDNDIIILSLSESEAGILRIQREKGVRVSIRATNLRDEDVSGKIKAMWTKMGSRSGSSGSGGIDEEEIIKIREDISDLQNSMSIGSNRVYLDYQNGKYGINTNPNRGADTFIPFKDEADIGDNVVFIDGGYDTPINEFSTITQIGVYVHIIESNSYWSELNIDEELFFFEDFEKMALEVQEG